MNPHRFSSETQVFVRRMVREHGPTRSDSILSGAEELMRTLRSLPPEIQRPVVELFMDVFDRASTRRPGVAADRLSSGGTGAALGHNPQRRRAESSLM